jgi:hypothetical protein
MVEPPPISTGNLLRWTAGDPERIGVAAAVDAGIKRVTIRFDDGETLQFAWPTESLHRLVLDKGQTVRLHATDDRGVIANVIPSGDRFLYLVSLADGSSKTVTEDGVRPAVETDPIARMRSGELDSARSVNLRIAGTRLLFAHQYDELSSLSNSRVEIKPHQVSVLHRVASTYPHRFILADEVGLGKTIEAGLLIKELKARGFAQRVLILAPSGIVSQWQYELKTKFNMPFADYRRTSIAWLQSENPGENVWTLRDNVIASTSFASWSEERSNEIPSPVGTWSSSTRPTTLAAGGKASTSTRRRSSTSSRRCLPIEISDVPRLFFSPRLLRCNSTVSSSIH